MLNLCIFTCYILLYVHNKLTHIFIFAIKAAYFDILHNESYFVDITIQLWENIQKTPLPHIMHIDNNLSLC